MKKVFQIVLILVVLGLGYLLYDGIMTPLHFQQAKAAREKDVIERIKDIRTAQRAYKQAHQRYTTSFDTLINFIITDTLTFERAFGSADDSLAVAKGLVKHEKFTMPAIDTVFGARKLTVQQVKDFELIPHGKGNKFIMDAGNFATESKVIVPVFVCRAPYKSFLADIDEQELINLIDERKTLDKYPGIKVGSLTEATNDAGNWE